MNIWVVNKYKYFCLIFLLLTAALSAIDLDLENISCDEDYLVEMLPKDGIRAIHQPDFKPLKDALENKSITNLKPDDFLILVEYNGVEKLYPIETLIWHEISNDLFDGKAISVSYCVLTGSAVVYEIEEFTRTKNFAVSGYLYQSNLVMYDLQTGSLWPQLSLQAISGVELGMRTPLAKFSLISFNYAKIQYSTVPVLIGDKKLNMFNDLYGKRPTPFLETYDDDENIESAVNPLFLAKKDSDYKNKELFIYFPDTEKAIPLAEAGNYPEILTVSKNSEGNINEVSTANNIPFITLYYFALNAFFPDAVILK